MVFSFLCHLVFLLFTKNVFFTTTSYEEKKQELENQLAQPEVYSNATKSRQFQAQLETLTTQIEELTTAWEAVSIQLEG